MNSFNLCRYVNSSITFILMNSFITFLMDSFIKWIHLIVLCCNVWTLGTHVHKQELFVMAIKTPTGKTFFRELHYYPIFQKVGIPFYIPLGILELIWWARMLNEPISTHRWRGCRVLCIWNHDSNSWCILFIKSHVVHFPCCLATI